MWLARVAAVACLCLGLDALDVPDTPDHLKCANGLFNQVQERLDTDMTALNEQLTGIQMQCAPAISRNQHVSSPDNTLTLLEKIQVMEETINHMKGKLNAAATKDDLRETEVSISETVEAVLNEIEGNVLGNLKEKDAKKLLNESVEVVVQSIGALGQCASEDKVAAVQERVQEMEQNYMEKIERLEEMMEEILNFTRTPLPTLPPSTITSNTPPEPVYPCEDSTFPGNNNDVCGAAVRFNKCRLQTVAYHCCRTCTAHNKLPEMGPWRYMNATRVVDTLNVIRSFIL